MSSTHWSIQGSSSKCSTTCDTAMIDERACFQLSCSRTALITLKRVGMKTSSKVLSSAQRSARRSRFSSPSCTTSSSSSSSSSSSASLVQDSTSSSTSSIHSTLRAMICSSKGKPSALQKSSERPQANDIAASMALCRTSSSAKCFAEASCRSRGQSCCRPLLLKNSGSSSAAEINASRVSFRGSSSAVGPVAKLARAAMASGMTVPSTCAFSSSRSSTS
mmetsp:Transcript_28692/g.60885  ORF Transcript_28692/g.60885 Transcript_28692/m.60885 type:complete len:220 (+) Transcript_28692:2155-2814(+)